MRVVAATCLFLGVLSTAVAFHIVVPTAIPNKAAVRPGLKRGRVRPVLFNSPAEDVVAVQPATADLEDQVKEIMSGDLKEEEVVEQVKNSLELATEEAREAYKEVVRERGGTIKIGEDGKEYIDFEDLMPGLDALSPNALFPGLKEGDGLELGNIINFALFAWIFYLVADSARILISGAAGPPPTP